MGTTQILSQDFYYSIYLVRLSLTTYYDYRVSGLQAHVNVLQKQRDTTISKLKAATRYDSTQQLLEKYGGAPMKPKTGISNRKPSSADDKPKRGKGEKTSFIPPPTANIPGRNIPVSMPNTPQRSTPATPGPVPPFTAAAVSAPWQRVEPASPISSNEEFAPNAFSPNEFSAPPHYAQAGQEHKWYDRFLDVLLGEDESHPKNRLALICKSCRLVNGQAPPGIKQMEDVGKWRCSSCRTMNGLDNEADRIVAEIKGVPPSRARLSEQKSEASSRSPIEAMDEEPVIVRGDEDPESDVTQYSGDEVTEVRGEEASKSSEEVDTKAGNIRRRSDRKKA